MTLGRGQILLTCQFQRFLYQTLCVFSQIKDRKHIKQNFHSVDKVMPPGCGGAGGVKNFSVGICDGAPSTARSSLTLKVLQEFLVSYMNKKTHIHLIPKFRYQFAYK